MCHAAENDNKYLKCFAIRNDTSYKSIGMQ